MKTQKTLLRATLLILFFIQFINLHAQQSDIYVDSTVTYFYLSPTDSTATNKTAILKDQGSLIQAEIYYQWNADTVWLKYTRNDYKYDLSDSLVEQINYRWNTDQKSWSYSYKDVYEYDVDGNKTCYCRFGWMADSGKWVLYNEWTYSFDPDGNSTGYVHGQRDSYSLEWKFISKYEIQYDASKDPVLETWYHWNQETDDWEYHVKEDQVFSQNRLDTVIVSYWDADTKLWEVNNKKVHSYNAPGYLVQILDLGWNSSEQVWIEGIKDEYTNDSNGNVIQHLRSTWNTTNNSWQERTKEINEFDLSGNKISSEKYLWDFLNNDWDGDSKQTFEFNQDNLLVEVKTYKWVMAGNSGSFIEDMKNTYIFDMDGYLTLYIRSNYFAGAGSYEAWEKTFYSYDKNINLSSVENLYNEDIVLYPVPVKDILLIKSDNEFGRIDIIDFTGKIVRTSQEKSVDLSSISSGVYLVNIYNLKGVSVSVQKIIKY